MILKSSIIERVYDIYSKQWNDGKAWAMLRETLGEPDRDAFFK